MPKIIINAPREGVAQSPHVGFGSLQNLDIHEVPGIARLNKKMFLESSTTITGRIKWMVRNPITTTEIFALDEDGVLYRSADSGGSWAVLSGTSSTNANGNGLRIFKDFLVLARDTLLDTYGPLSGATFTVTIASPAVFSKTAHGLELNDIIVFATTGALPTGLTAGTTYYIISAGLTADNYEVSTSQGGAAVNTSGSQSGVHTYKSWKLGYQTIDSDVLWHPMFVSKNDNKLYGGAGRYVFSLDEVSGQTFTPSVSATETYTQQALDLPSNYRIKCLEELGNNLMMGTWQGTNVYDFPIADIFPWDRSSTSFGQSVNVKGEFGVHAMINDGGSLVVLAGITGGIFRSNGANARKIAQLPQDLTVQSTYGSVADTFIAYFPGAIVNYKDKVYFGIGNGADTLVSEIGTYSLLQTSKGSILNLEHTNALLTDGTSVPVKISALLPISKDRLLQAYQNDDPVVSTATYGIELTSVSSRIYLTDYAGYFESILFEMGDDKNKWKPSNLKITLGRPLRTAEGLQISYRTSLANTFTVVKTMAFADAGIGAIQSKTFAPEQPFNIKEGEKLQMKVALLGGVTGGIGTTPEFKQLILE